MEQYKENNKDEYTTFINLPKIKELTKYVNTSLLSDYEETFIQLPYNRFIEHEFNYNNVLYKYLTFNDEIIQMYYSAPILYNSLLNLKINHNQSYFTVNEYGLIGIYQKSLNRVILYRFNEKYKNMTFNIWMPPNKAFIRLYSINNTKTNESKNYIQCDKPKSNYYLLTSFLNLNRKGLKENIDEFEKTNKMNKFELIQIIIDTMNKYNIHMVITDLLKYDELELQEKILQLKCILKISEDITQPEFELYKNIIFNETQKTTNKIDNEHINDEHDSNYIKMVIGDTITDVLNYMKNNCDIDIKSTLIKLNWLFDMF